MATLTIEGTTISHVRGDTGVIGLNLTKDGEPYTLGMNDVALFTVKKSVYDTDYVLQKTAINGRFNLLHADTQNITPGTYKYDVQVTTADGQVITVIGPATYKLLPDVTTN